jgi:tetratricopeptide (TPR) repeat protein
MLYRLCPKDKDVAVQFANALADQGDSVLGERILADLYRSHPMDNELAQALKNISARKTMDEGGYDAIADGSGSYRDILKNEAEAVTLEQENRQVKAEDATEKLIGHYEARLKTEPANLKLLRDLAELYIQLKDYDKALAYYEKMKAAGANDPTLDRSISDTRLKKLEVQISLLDPNANNYHEESARLEAEKQAFALAECQKRVERFPTDLQFRFELGQMYFQSGKYSEAIQEFQKAQSNPHRRIASMSYLAQCFAKRRMFDLSAKTFQNALKEKLIMDEEKKELLYQLGLVLDLMGKKDDAVEQYKLIYEVDIGYKDVAAKVDAYYSGQS